MIDKNPILNNEKKTVSKYCYAIDISKKDVLFLGKYIHTVLLCVNLDISQIT